MVFSPPCEERTLRSLQTRALHELLKPEGWYPAARGLSTAANVAAGLRAGRGPGRYTRLSMAEPSQAAPAPAGELRVELHRFLSLEAPFLVPAMPEGVPDEEAEAALLLEVERRLRPAERLADDEIYPAVTAARAAGWRREELEVAIRGFFRRRRIRASLTRPERRLMLRTMLLTRAIDEFLKQAFDRKEIVWEGYPSPQKGFRSTGQEAIVGAALRLRRPPASAAGPGYDGDYIAPLIRDLGAAADVHARSAPPDARPVRQGRHAGGRPGPARRRHRARGRAAGGAAGHRRPDPGRDGARAAARRQRPGLRRASSATAARAWASGTRRSTSPPCAGWGWSS